MSDKKLGIFSFCTAIYMLLLFSCQMKGKDNNIIDDNINVDLVQREVKLKKTILCDTAKIPVNIIYPKSEIVFSLKSKDVFLQKLEKCKQEGKAQTIKTIQLRDIDTIPNELKIFTNVENVFVYAGSNLQGISVFKKLKRIYLYSFNGELPANLFNTNIEVFLSEQSELKGFYNIDKAVNIKEIFIGGTIIDSLPKLSNLRGLLRFEIAEYNGISIKLSRLDFTENKCLQVLTLQSRLDNFISIPNGIKNHNFLKLHIYHFNLSDTEKHFLKKLGNIESPYYQR
jgi:hypothetical protein